MPGPAADRVPTGTIGVVRSVLHGVWGRTVSARRVVVVACVFVACVGRQGAIADELAMAAGVESGVLENGVRYVAVERDVSRGAVWLTINTGSLDEPAGQNGVAELVMRLSLRAPAHFEPGEVERLFRATDVLSGQERHGVTGYEQTLFTLGLAGRGAGLDEALLFCADLLGEPVWDEALVERERASLVERSRLMDRSLVRVQDELLNQIAPGCAAVGRWPGGTTEDLDALEVEDVRSFRDAWYTPRNATVVVVSAEPASLISGRIQSALANIPFRAAADRTRTTPRLENPPEITIVTDEGLSRAAAGVVRLTPPRGPTITREDLREELFDAAVAEAMTRRLEQDRKSRTLAGSAVRAETRDIFSALRVYQAGAEGPAEDALDLVRGLHHSVTSVIRNGTESVAQQAAWRRIRDAYDEKARARGASEIALWFTARAFERDALLGPEAYADEAARLAREVPAPLFDERMATLFAGEGVMTVLQSPVPLDERAVARAVVVGRDAIEAIEERRADASSVFERGGPGGVVDEMSRHGAFGVTTAWLSSGVRVLHKPLDAESGRVSVQLTLAGGRLEETSGSLGMTAAAVGAIESLAVRGVPSVALARALDERGITLEAEDSIDSINVRLSGPSESLIDILGVVRAVLEGPVVEPGAVEAWRDRFELERSRNERVAYRELPDEIRRAWFGGDPRLMPLSRMQADTVRLEQVQAWVDRHASAPAAVSIVGDVPWHDALDDAADMLGGLDGRRRIARGVLDSVRGVEPPAASVRREVTLELAEGAAAIAWGFNVPSLDEIDRARAMVAGAWVLSERLKARVVGPEADGAAIAAWAGYREDNAFDLYACIEAVVVADPRRVDEMIAQTEAIAIELGVDGPTRTELEAFKERARELVLRSMENPTYLARVLAEADLRGRPLDDLASMEARYQSLTAREIRDEMRDALTNRPRVSVIIRPGESQP